ncbi:hypothetical protein BCR33DRAFT_768286 [Rhizoclosmatium globosum]|uniref:Uncharacterized protein n=1 Tax=Rhizoclosmatium globosum TaxID=329046 RepID=A0A1Y2BYN9_9FUNG|nr:hypothetical protein BCR33DRAFT_768286 [Rhizoclosmatium globosum]|eukprot:ORY39889.1 hypothetical protein BCR33DRAFT_768286 [Rhizoclosmatium globosum]
MTKLSQTTPRKGKDAGDDSFDNDASFFISPKKRKLLGMIYAAARGSERQKYFLTADKIEEYTQKKLDPNSLKKRRETLDQLADDYNKAGEDDGDIVMAVTESIAASSTDPVTRLYPLIKLLTSHVGHLAATAEAIKKRLDLQDHKANIRLVKAAGISDQELEMSKMSKTDRLKMVAAGKKAEKKEAGKKSKKEIIKKRPAKKKEVVVLDYESSSESSVDSENAAEDDDDDEDEDEEQDDGDIKEVNDSSDDDLEEEEEIQLRPRSKRRKQ